MAQMHDVHPSRQKGYERACWWLNQKVSVVPIRSRSKRLYPGYGSRSAHIIDGEFAREWFLRTDANLGVVLDGEPRLIVADWDGVRNYEVWREATGASVNTLAERTGRGYHLFFFGIGLSSAVGDGCEFKMQQAELCSGWHS